MSMIIKRKSSYSPSQLFQTLSILLITTLILSACSQPTPVNLTIGTVVAETETALPTVTLTPAPTTTPTPTPIPYFINSQVWNREPAVPVILYHRFLPDSYKESTATKIRLGDFRTHLQMLYDAGYSLIPLEDWLAGKIDTPIGRHPLIFTIDDAYFADQLYLDPDGTPSLRSGIGVLWQFYKEHPDFGFSAALFSNMGDKLYGNVLTPTWFNVGPGWQKALGEAIAWGIEHNVMPYNHFYTHPNLKLTEYQFIKPELRQNDDAIRHFLTITGHESLIPRLRNIIALPYSIWPPSKGSQDLIINYRDPADQPVLAVVEAYYYSDKKTTLPYIYSPAYDRFHIPRITTNTLKSINYLVDNKDQFPVMQNCPLGPADRLKQNDPEYIKEMIDKSVSSGACPAGFYRVDGVFYNAFDQPAAAIEASTTGQELYIQVTSTP